MNSPSKDARSSFPSGSPALVRNALSRPDRRCARRDLGHRCSDKRLRAADSRLPVRPSRFRSRAFEALLAQPPCREKRDRAAQKVRNRSAAPPPQSREGPLRTRSTKEKKGRRPRSPVADLKLANESINAVRLSRSARRIKAHRSKES